MARFEAVRRKQLPLLKRLRLPPKHAGRQRWGLRFLKKHEVEWATSSSTLRAQTGLSLAARSQHFKRQFPEAHMNATLLRKVYSLNGVKKKRLSWYKVVPEHDEASLRQDLARMKRQLTMAKNDGYRFVYLDETMVTRKTVPLTEWARPKENMRADQAKL